MSSILLQRATLRAIGSRLISGLISTDQARWSRIEIGRKTKSVAHTGLIMAGGGVKNSGMSGSDVGIAIIPNSKIFLTIKISVQFFFAEPKFCKLKFACCSSWDCTRS